MLLAVLLMVFAALLGSTFITVVALNLNQTARQENLAASRSATQAGISFVNDRLTYSPEGERWRPESISLPPRPGTADFNIYYNALERAQGWTRTVGEPPAAFDGNGDFVTYGAGNAEQRREEEWLYIAQQLRTNPTDRCFVKFPDPRGAAPNNGAPQYLAEVRTNRTVSGGVDGLLKITVIGQSEDNPNTFKLETAYKAGTVSNPLVTNARTVTNWDFDANTVPEARVAVPAATQVEVGEVKGQFPPLPFYVTIDNAGSGGTRVLTALVVGRTVLSSGRQRLQFSAGAQVAAQAVTGVTPATATAAPGDRVQVAAVLGSPTAVDYERNSRRLGAVAITSGGAPLYGIESVAFRPSEQEAVAAPPPARVRVNGGLIWMGNALLSNLTGSVPNSSLAGPTAGPAVAASGLMALRTYNTSTRRDDAIPRVLNFGSPGINARLASSSEPGFPFPNSTAENNTPINRQQALQRINDGYDRLRGAPAPVRDVASFTPPTIASSRGGINRYRQVTQYSAFNTTISAYGTAPAGSSVPALHGYGEGIYINNAQDVEKVLRTGTTALRSMNRAELRQLWFGEAVDATASRSTSFQRQAKPYGIGQLSSGRTLSLEQRHLRGWIGPDEFRARGALVELRPEEEYIPGNATTRGVVYVTLDALSDSAGINPDPDRSFFSPDGTRPSTSRRYRRRLPWPRNGTLFAEGNVRIKGGAFLPDGRPNLAIDPHRSLTIVSMNNIYIEGSLNAGSRKVLLLARHNVVLNPTTVLTRPEGYTNITSQATMLGVPTLTVEDALSFRRGDWVEYYDPSTGSGSQEPRQVIGVPNATTLQLNAAFSNPANKVLRVIADPLQGATSAATPPRFAARLGRFSDVIQRRFSLPGGSTEVRMALRQSAARREAMQVQADITDPLNPLAPTNIQMDSKYLTGDPRSSLIPSANKNLRVEYTNSTGPHTDQFSTTTPSSGNDLRTNSIFRLGVDPTTPPTTPKGLEKQFEDLNSSTHNSEGWEYDPASTGPINNYGQAAVGTPGPLMLFLAAFTNRTPPQLIADVGPAPNLIVEPREPRSRPTLHNGGAGTAQRIAVGTSVTSYFNVPAPDAADVSTPFTPSQIVNDRPGEVVSQFGFSHSADGTEDAVSIDDKFYVNNPPTVPSLPVDPALVSVDNDNAAHWLDSRRFRSSTLTGGENAVAFRLNDKEVRLNATETTGQRLSDFWAPGRNPIPYHRMAGMKLESYEVDAAGVLTSLSEGATIDVRAFCYAQEGSWVVLAGGYFDERVRSEAVGSDSQPFVDNGTPAMPGIFEANNSDGTRDDSDLNKDGVTTQQEKMSVFRMLRLNYKVNFTGAICEKTTMPVVEETLTATGVVNDGSVEEWMDRMTTFRFRSSAPFADLNGDQDGVDLPVTTASYSQAQIPRGNPLNAVESADPGDQARFGNISYNFDPSMTSLLGAPELDQGFRPPVSPELIYQD